MTEEDSLSSQQKYFEELRLQTKEVLEAGFEERRRLLERTR
jgi:hypothetical protein